MGAITGGLRSGGYNRGAYKWRAITGGRLIRGGL